MSGDTANGIARRCSTYTAGPNAVLPVFEAFQAARVEFAQEVAKLALPNDPCRSTSAAAPGGTYEVDGPEKVVAALEASYTLVSDIRPLLSDQSAAVRENAMLALGRLAGMSTKLQTEIADDEMVRAATNTIATGVKPSLLKAALYLLHTTVKPSADAAKLALECNVLPALLERIEDNDSQIKSASVWCLAAMANHDRDLAFAVVDGGAVSLLMQCLKEPSLPLRRVALACLGCIAKHSDGDLAALLETEGAIGMAKGFLTHKDMLLRRQACTLLALAVQHKDAHIDWIPAESRADLVDTLRVCVGVDGETGAAAATLLQQLAKRPAVASALVQLEVVPLLVAHIASGMGSPAPAAAALGHICDAEAEAAKQCVGGYPSALDAIKAVLSAMPNPSICAVMCAALGAIAAAGEGETASAVAKSGLLRLMAEATVLSKRKLGPATQALARKGLAKAVSKCAEYEELVWLIEALPFRGAAAESEVLAAVLSATAKRLDRQSVRLNFMQRGALTLCQEAKGSSSAELRGALKQLNDTYPEQMVKATDPNYEKKLLDLVGEVS